MTTRGMKPSLTHSQLIQRELDRCVPLGAGKVRCGSCCAPFENGYSFLEHFVRLTGDIECASPSIMAAAGFARVDGLWSKP